MSASKNIAPFAMQGFVPTPTELETPESRLLRLVIAAIDKNPDNRGAIRGHILGAVRHDVSLLWALTKDWHGTATDTWIGRAYEARAQKREQIARGHRKDATQAGLAPRNGGGSASPTNQTTSGQERHENHRDVATRNGGGVTASATKQNTNGQEPPDPHHSRAARNGGGVPSPTPMTAGSQRAKFGIAARAYVAQKLSKLDTFLVNGRPIGDCTPDEVRAWLTSQNRNVRFAEMLISNLPPNRPIREFIRAEEAESVYELAGKTE